jgi:MFS family permease
VTGRGHTIDTVHLDRLRFRSSLLLLAGVSVGSTAFIISMTVTALVAQRITGDPAWTGVPVAATILGTACGTWLLSVSMSRWGRRRGLIASYATAAVGGLIACVATFIASFSLLITGVFVLGVGNSANALTRYVAADLQPPPRRATMIGWIVWSGTVGAVLGPNLLAPADEVGVSSGLPPLAGPYLASTLTFLGAAVLYLIMLKPDPGPLSFMSNDGETRPAATRTPVSRLFRTPRVRVASVALVLGHVVMVLLMTMTDYREH